MTARKITLLGLLVGLTAAGCQNSHVDMVAFLKAHEHEVSAIDYRVGIPDAVEIVAPRVEEIDGIRQVVRPDGKIALKLVGPVKVVGLTEKEIAAKLTEQLTPFYENPKVQVRVTGYHSKKIYLYGQVAQANGGSGGSGAAAQDAWMSLPYTGRDTVLDVLAQSGMSFIAWRNQVHIIRSSPFDNERHEIVVDVERMMTTGDTSDNVLLQPNDILYVPPTPLGWVGLRIQEVLFPFQPVMNAYTFPASLINAQDVYSDD